MTRVYVAASSREPARVRKVMLWVRDRGMILTLDWLTEIEANLARGLRDKDLSPAEQGRHAQADLDAIREADVVWMLAPLTPSKGAYVELGYALGIGKPVVVSGGAPSIFVHLAAVVAETDEGGLAAIEGLMRPRASAVLACDECGCVIVSGASCRGCGRRLYWEAGR